MSKNMTKIMSILLALALMFAFAGCQSNEDEKETQAENTIEETTTQEQTTEQETTTETTTAAPTTTVPETTTLAEGEAIKDIVATLEGKKFYLTGVMTAQTGEVIDMKMTCDGEDYRLDMDSSQMDMSMIYLNGSPYVVNNSTKSYILFDDAAIDNLDTVLNSFSSLGVSLSSADMNEMKSMMTDFDQNMDFSQYINDGEYEEYDAPLNGVEHLCSMYSTEYGKIRMYTLDGTLKQIDVYDADGLCQMSMEVSAFIPMVPAPISLNGLKLSPSILDLFGISM